MNTNEVLLKENGQWLHFTEPKQIITAHDLNAVIPSLHEIEKLVSINRWHAAGFISYEAAPAFDKAIHPERSEERSLRRTQSKDTSGFPLLWFGLYPAPRVMDIPEPFDQTQGRPASAKPTLSWRTTIQPEEYNAAIEQIKHHIAEGQTYQVNYTMRLRAEFQADPWDFFLHLAQTQNNHAAYIDTGRYAIASASPELFFQLDGDTITSRPMKGTTHRGRTTLEDEKQAQWLKDSGKNRAENVMIVDMVRNDMGRIAKTGSVHVPELFSVEKYPTLWQMTSTVQAKTSASITEIFKALFPCASITGAPKVSTMRIISELETTPRQIYTGTIGHISPNRKATFNVAIRTALIDRETQTAEYGIGSGVIWDSKGDDEYSEALLKARVLTESTPEFSLLETMLWTPKEGFFLREKHIARLVDSAGYFDFPIARSGGITPPRHIEIYLDEISSQFTSPQRVRLLLDNYGNITSESKPFEPSENNRPLNIRLTKEPVHSENVFLFHKTTHRDIYDFARKDFPNCDDVLLYNEKNELTEFTIGNLVVELNGKLYTPPILCGLLAGTFREYLLETGQVEEKAIHMQELKNCTKIFLVNSVRKWCRVEIM